MNNKIIIYLEDDANMRHHTTSMLEDIGYKVENFRRIDQIKELFFERMNDVECIITDLNMDDEWLEEYQNESDGGMLSGWVWLQRFVYPYVPNMPTIIYSGYIQYLNEHLKEKEELHLLKKEHIKCVEKGSGNEDGFSGLQLTLNKLLNEGKDL